ncbi:MAG TPA: glycoside hydrolase [Blastocatellia bacterium]|nr:glycoside hydrolase [Blastocatellia bacterium]
MFKSFFLAGFEGSTGYNLHRQWFDQVAATQHDLFLDEDYRRLRDVGIFAAREAVRWPLVDRRGHYDFSSVQRVIEASQRHGIEIIYDLFHFGYPDNVDLFSKEFPRRFAQYCYAAARYIAERAPGVCYFTPVNEPSFFAWAAGEVGLFAPYLEGRGWELKARLAEAAIHGINAIWTACPEARIVNVDPLCRVCAPPHRPDLQWEVDNFNSNSVLQAWDILSGRLLPELGGSKKHLGIIGVNYYWTNQWEWGRPGIPLGDDDPRRRSLRELLRFVWQRYGVEMLITETAHKGEMRPVWLREMADEAEAALDEGIPLRGVCLYPILAMPEWHVRQEWTEMGLWDLVMADGTLQRVPYAPALEAFREAQRLENHELHSGREPNRRAE